MFTRITLPLLWDLVQVALVYVGMAALDFFTIVAVMTEGGPNRASDVAAYYLYTTCTPPPSATDSSAMPRRWACCCCC